MRKIMLVVMAVVLCVTTSALADVANWQIQAAATTGNVVADGTGWTLDGTTGVDFDYGALDAFDGKPVDGSAIEYILNATDAATSTALGYFYSWSPGGERIVFKLEQWSNTGKFGLTTPGYWDKTMATASVFDQDVHVVLRRNSSGTIDLFINGVFAETEATKTNWRMDGGMGILGAGKNLTTDVVTGTIYAVGTYDVALTDEQITDLYTAYVTNPKMPNTPDPQDGEEVVAVDLSDRLVSGAVSWVAPIDPDIATLVGYTVYIDPNETDVTNATEATTGLEYKSVDQPDVSFAPTADLAYDTTYYWRVDLIADYTSVPGTDPNIIKGDVWSFTTAPETPTVTDPISVTEPLGGTATLTVTHSRGTSYKWFKGGDEYSSGTLTADGDIVLTISPLAVADEGFYHCEVYNSAAPEPTPDPDAVSAVVQVMSERLVAHWAFEGNLDDSVDDIGGTAAGDWPGTPMDPNTANPTPTLSYATGILGGQALDLSDPNDSFFVKVISGNGVWADSNDLFNFYPQGFTVTAWIKGAPDGGNWQLAVGKQDRNAAEAGWAVGRRGLYAFGNLRGAGGPVDIVSTGDVDNGQWALVAVTYDPADLGHRLYAIDNETNKFQFVTSVNQLTQTPPITPANLVLAAENVYGTSTLTGLLDEVKIYSYPLAPEVIANEYRTVTGNTPCMGTEGLDYDWDGNCVVDLADFTEFAKSWLNTQLLP